MYIYFMLKERNIMLKTEFMEKLRLFSEELKTLGNFLESGFVWHFSDNDLLMNVLQEQCEHADPYCRMIKGNPYRKLNRCIHFHHDESFRKLRLSPGFRIAECHAGVKTLAVGMTVSGSPVRFGPETESAGRLSQTADGSSLRFGVAARAGKTASDPAPLFGSTDSRRGQLHAGPLL